MSAVARKIFTTDAQTIPDRTGFWDHLGLVARTTHQLLQPIALRAAIKNRCRYEAAIEFEGQDDEAADAYDLFFEKLYDSLTREAEARGFRL